MSNRWNVTLILSLAYFVTGYLGLQFPVFGTNITLVWLPAGISVGFLMRFGYGCWPGVAIGALAVNLVNGLSIPLALGIASGNTLGPILATYLLRRTGFHATFEQHRDILLLCLSATVGMLVTASVGVTSLAWTDQIQAGFLQAWLTWWGRDAIGVIAATPLVLVITLEWLRFIWRRGFEFSIWISLLVVAIIFVFILNGDWVSSLFALSILPFPLVVWGAMRYGAIGTSTCVILWAFGAAIGMAMGRGPFLRAVPLEGVIELWLFMVTTAVLGWIVSNLNALQAHAVRFQQLLERALGEASVGVLLTGRDGLITYANNGFTRLTGYHGTELIGQNCSCLQGADTNQETVKKIRLAIHSDGYFEGEILNYRKDGSEFWNALLISPVHNARRELTGFLGIQQDVTSRKLAELGLLQSEERLRTIVELEPECVKIVAMDGRLLEMNRAGLAMIEAESIEQVRGAKLEDLIVDEDRAKFISLHRRVVTQGEMGQCEFGVVGLKGTRRWLETHAVPYRNERNEIVGLLGVTRDVTQKRRDAEALERTLSTLKLFVDSVPALIAFVDDQERYRLINRRLAEYFNMPADEVIGRLVGEMHPRRAYAEIAPRIRRALDGEIVTYQTELIRPDGTEIRIDAQFIPRRESDGSISGAFVLVFDITESKRNELALVASQRRLDEILNSIQDVVYSAKPDRAAMTFVSAYAQELFGCPPVEFIANPKKWRSVVHPDDIEALESTFPNLESSNTYDEVYRIVRRDRSIRWVRDRGRLRRDAEGQPMNIDGILTDITVQHDAVEKLQASETRYRDLFKSNPHPMWVYDFETLRFLAVNDAAIDHYGYSEAEFLGMTILEIRPAEEAPRLISSLSNLPDSFQKSGVWTHETKSRAKIEMETAWHTIEFGGRRAGVVLANDVTETRRVHEQVLASLSEKEALLKEIHHRVKNNLQIVTSLLSLQADAYQAPETLGVLKESRDRIRSMAMVHEALYRSGNLGSIDLVQYVDSLCSYLFRSYGVDSDRVQLVLCVTNVTLDLDRAIPFGLIINELISNSLKYAFPNNRNGRISVELQASSERFFSLVVADNGIGLPQQLDIKGLKSLGLQLVNDLTAQLGGSLVLSQVSGTEFRMCFPIEISGKEL